MVTLSQPPWEFNRGEKRVDRVISLAILWSICIDIGAIAGLIVVRLT